MRKHDFVFVITRNPALLELGQINTYEDHDRGWVKFISPDIISGCRVGHTAVVIDKETVDCDEETYLAMVMSRHE